MKKIFNGKLLKVCTKKTVLPNGQTINLEIVNHPGAVLIVPFLAKHKIIMLRQYRAVIGKYLYELPAGTLAPKERPSSCAKRELIEETGYKPSKINKIGQIYPCPGYSTEKIIFFKAQGLIPAQQALEKDEVIELKLMSGPQIKKIFKQGKIEDAKTICALSLCGMI